VKDCSKGLSPPGWAFFSGGFQMKSTEEEDQTRPSLWAREWKQSQKGKKQGEFLVPNPRHGLDGANALRWYGRLRELIPPLSVINSNQVGQPSFHA